MARRRPNGFSMGISNRDDLYGRILQARDKLSREALHGVRVEMDGVKTFDRSPERIPSAYSSGSKMICSSAAAARSLFRARASI